MNRTLARVSPPTLVVFVAVVAAGVAVNDGFAFSLRTAPAILLMAAGLAGVASQAGERSLDSLQLATKRWWLLAVAAFIPYALVTAPATESATAVGDAVAGPMLATTLEAVAGALVLCAIAITVLYGLASYGIHPGGPSPEERVLRE
ncbi:DUF1467 domain-containing protein [Natrononativus amylolyticus]|uniref:DUF1467 domain-containing protein n=1 Tax=Natrononativus amylolyticus TaxID=2963434 RepID=UPI0020CBE14A|nr:DUF1467 domain-containing protein [Natrononativus amylolyticus]